MKNIVYGVLAAVTSATAAYAIPPFSAPPSPPQITIERHTVVRIRTYAPPSVQPIRPIEWKERKGPKCIRMDMLAGAAINEPDSVDLTLRGGSRIRARLEKGCSSESFYSGFYLKPAGDGQVCVKRDNFHARMGGDCTIVKFHSLAQR